MRRSVAPDEQADALSVLYASHDLNQPSAGGVGLIFAPPAAAADATHGTLCAVLSFPDLHQVLTPDEARDALGGLIRYVTKSYFEAERGGAAALQEALAGLHLYVQYLSQNAAPRAAWEGQAACAEVRGRMLSLAFSEGTFNIVTKYSAADVFPPLAVSAARRIGNRGALRAHAYQAELRGTGTFFMGTDVWGLRGVPNHRQQAHKQELARAVAHALSPVGEIRDEFWRSRNPDCDMPGLLMGFRPQALPLASEAFTFVAPTPPEDAAAETGSASGDAPPSPVRDRASSPPRPVDAQDAGPLAMHAEIAGLETSQDAKDARLRLWSRRAGNKLREWFSEVFPDPQADAPAPPRTRGAPDVTAAASKAADTGANPTVDASAAPPRALDPPLFLQTWRRFEKAWQPKPDRKAQSRPWVAMTLLLLLVIVPIATWIAYNINDDPTAGYDATATLLMQQHLDNARTYLEQERTGLAQQELQTASNLIQAHIAAGGLTPQVRAIQFELQALWNDAYQIVPLVGLTEPLIRFDRDAAPAKVVVHTQDLYVLLKARANEVVKYRLDLLQQEGSGHRQSILRQGSLVEGVEVGRIVDMAFQPTKTAQSDKPSLYLIDDRRNLFQYNDTDLISVVDLGQQRVWDAPLLINFYSNRMYVVDGGPGQIWRYNLNGNVRRQTAWLAEPVNLSQAIRMHVDERIWLLLSNNSVVVFGSNGDPDNPANIQHPFGVKAAIALDSRFVDLEVGGNQSDYLLLPDPGQESILVLNEATGDFLYRLVAPEGVVSNFDALADVAVHRERIYILTQDFLFEHSFDP